MDNQIELLPCPFCGGEAILTSRETNYFATRYFVMCEQCHAESKNCQHKEDAVYAWNKRADQPVLMNAT